jgi:hypothetical protein
MRRISMHPMSLIAVLVALAPPRAQGTDLVHAGKKGIDIAPLRFLSVSERPCVAKRHHPPMNQKRMDRHAFRKHQVPRNRTGRKR